MMGISEEELYNIPTAEYIHRHSGFIFRHLTVYHVAFHALADLRNVEVPNQICSRFFNSDITTNIASPSGQLLFFF